MFSNFKSAIVFTSLVSLASCTQTSTPSAPTAPTTAAVASDHSATHAFLEITLHIADANRAKAAAVYSKYKRPFLHDVPGAQSKQLLIRDQDVAVLHGFDTTAHAEAYLQSSLFTKDVVGELAPLLESPPDVRIYMTP